MTKMESSILGSYKCSQPECSVETTGKCVNGLKIEDCPNKIGIIIEDTQVLDEENLTIVDSKTIRLSWGDNFSESDIGMITYKYPCKLILLVGEPSCGKSTLYGALFDSFQKGGCGKYIFNATKTPIGFERICHFAREKSKGKYPDTERTKLHEFTYYHLAVRQKDLSLGPKHLVFADVNGEKFQAAKVDDDEVLKLNILNRADAIFFIADGELLTDNKEKHIVKKDVWNMISRCVQNNMFRVNQNINLIITKWDVINAAGKSKEVNDFLTTPTLEKFGGIIKKVIKVASRSLNDEIPPRTGIDEFLELCVKDHETDNNPKYSGKISRQFQIFKYEVCK